MAMWNKGLQSLAFLAPASKRCHVGFGPGLINEDKVLDVDTVWYFFHQYLRLATSGLSCSVP
jgi:hypothetical protein